MVEKIDCTEFNNPVHTILADNEFESLREEIEECGTQFYGRARTQGCQDLSLLLPIIKNIEFSIPITLSPN
jgi:hypothetical protein